MKEVKFTHVQPDGKGGFKKIEDPHEKDFYDEGTVELAERATMVVMQTGLNNRKKK